MSTVEESPTDEEPGVKELEKTEQPDETTQGNSSVETEPAMLEEEEMPSYVSLNSLSRPEESKVEQVIAQQAENQNESDEKASSPYPSEHGADSVCVVSSEDMMEDYDSEEEMDMEEEEEDENEGDFCNDEEEDDEDEEEEEESDGDIEPEQFERSSDDFVLRYDGGLEKHHKERSRSLQDMTNSRGNLSRFVGKRRCTNISGSSDLPLSRPIIQESLEDPLLIRKKPPRTVKYDHVPSKVKLYIEAMRKQSNRNSTERLNRENCQETKSPAVDSRDDIAEILTLDPNKKIMKDYAQNAIDELARNDGHNLTEENYGNPLEINEKSQRMSTNVVAGIKETEENKKRANLDCCPQNLASEYSNKAAKVNGLTDHAENDGIIETEMVLETNGQEQIAAITNVSSVSYEEFANGGKSSTMNVENSSSCRNNNEENEHDDKERPIEEMIIDERTTEHSNNAVQLTAWNLRRLTNDEPVKRRGYSQVDSEIHQKVLNEKKNLKRELEDLKKNIEQYEASIDSLKQAYQNSVLKNKNLEEELKQVKNKFAEFRRSNVRPETSVASIQTEKMDVSNGKSETASTSAGFSSIEKFSESTCTIEMSTVPSMDTVPTEDSATVEERPMSCSFLTSSRILQTLASLTQGRSKRSGERRTVDETKNIHANVVEHDRSKRPTVDSTITGNGDASTSRAKKRKISDTLDPTESFKIPCTPGETRRKTSSNSAADVWTEMRKERATAVGSNRTDEKNSSADPERATEQVPDHYASENIKYFVYHDDPYRKERSFLIQAQDSDSNEETVKNGNIHECGPFLLGDIEIRMRKIDGIINVYGKEIEDPMEGIAENNSQESGKQDSAFVPRSSFSCQSTPYAKNHLNASSCCSSKKRVSPKFSKSGIAKYLRSAAANFSRNSSDDNEQHYEIPCTDYKCCHCQYCASHRKQRTRLPSCELLPKVIHSCCVHSTLMNEKGCDCENEMIDESTMYETLSNILADCDKCRHHTSYNSIPKQQGRLQSHASHHGQDFHQTKISTSSCNCNTCSCGVTVEPRRHNCHQGNLHSSCSHTISCGDDDDDGEPLLSSDSPIEPPETKRRRVTGKKLRDLITDLLRGCGGCKDPHNASNLSGANLPNATPKIVVTPCSPASNKASCSKQPHLCPTTPNSSCNRLANDSSCDVHEIRATVNNQLEILQEDVEQIQMRTRSLFAMLQKLKQIGTD